MGIHEQDPTGRMLLIRDDFSSQFTDSVDTIAEELGITRAVLPAHSPRLNPIEPIWDSVKWDLSLQAAESTEQFRAPVLVSSRQTGEFRLRLDRSIPRQ